MNIKIKHRRLYAFYNSKVLNAMSISVAIMLPLLKYTEIALPVLIAVVLAILLFVAYSCWIWFRKPSVVTINRWLSDLSTYFMFYALVVIAIKSDSFLCPSFSLVAGLIVLFITSLKNRDERFEI